ncbi:hypothetical protein CFRS1_v015872 [Colletotrichum fructicola]|nr:hypothetical protein CFRS1_v015872 [Colletotrichum fructicola]
MGSDGEEASLHQCLLPRTFHFSPSKPNPIQTKEIVVCDVKKDYLYIDNKLPFDINPWAEFKNIIVESSKSDSNRITFSSFPNLKKVVNGVRLTPHMAHGRLLSIGKPCCSPRLDILKDEGRWLSQKPRWMDQARESYESPGDVEGIPFMVHNLMFGKPDDFYEVALTQASELGFRSTTSEEEGLEWG